MQQRSKVSKMNKFLIDRSDSGSDRITVIHLMGLLLKVCKPFQSD